MSQFSWHRFPFPSERYVRDRQSLRQMWSRLHRGDCEPFPEDERVQEAWRLYHEGEFRQAHDLGLESGLDGYSVATKAAMIYANSVEEDQDRRLAVFRDVVARCLEWQRDRPEAVNGWFHHAYALGRIAQYMSTGEALSQGIVGKIKASLERTLALEPEHGDAHTTFGTFHAEVIEKGGAMVAGLMFGAKKDSAVSHYEKALRLNPESPVVRLEYGRGLLRMYGRGKAKDARRLFNEAAGLAPANAMERLDVEAARAALEDLD